MKLGFACKYLNADLQQPYPFKSPTRKRFLSLDQDKRRELLLTCASHNLSQLAHIFSELAQLPHQFRMMRIGSDLLPLFTVPEAQEPYQSLLPDLLPLFAHAGALAKKADIRLSFHPGQYTVQDFKINIHMNGRAGFAGFKAAFERLSPEARLMLTVENDEVSCSLDDVLQARDLCPIVLDIHHHWVKENQFIQPDDARIARVKESWRGVRPVLHYSISQEGLIPEQGFPDQESLGLSKMKLRAHSDYYFNDTLNDWALSFSDFDIMCEVKMKNIASAKLLRVGHARPLRVNSV
jgi:UV DNA damage repair endonuclease